jgi:hypothetical protein
MQPQKPGDPVPGTPDEVRLNEALIKEKEARAATEKLQAQTMPMWDQYRSMLKQDQQMREQESQMELSQLQQQQTQIPQQQKNNWINAFSSILAVAVPIALVFGMKGNGFAKGAMMSALGAAFKGYAEGRHQAAEEHMHDFDRQAKAIHESNMERSRIYKDIWANKRMELEDQFKMTQAVAKEFMDPTLMRAARNRDMNGVTKHLATQEKADKNFVTVTNKAGEKIRVPRPTNWAAYQMFLIDRPQEAKGLTYTDWEQKYATQTERKETEKDAEEEPSPEDLRSKLFGD